VLSQREYRPHFRERFGFLPRSFKRTDLGSLWLHAVSVGEVASVIPLLKLFREMQPSAPIYLSTSTVAGRAVAERDVAQFVDGIFYCPLDFASTVRRALRVVRPALLVIVETEIWPNLFHEAKLAGVSLAIVNGRISDRTWPRYQKWKELFTPVLRLPDLVLVQSRTDYERYLELGVERDKLRIEGNLKYDTAAARSPLKLPTCGAEQIWVAASTVGPNEKGSLASHNIDEDDIVLDAFDDLRTEFPKLLLVLAPRQPARFEAVAAKLRDRKLHHIRRSQTGGQTPTLPGVLLLDTMGELARIYSIANVVFVGGSLAPRGGHNIVEPAAAGVPIVIGPHMQNFQAITSDFKEAEAIVQIGAAAELTSAIRTVLKDPERGRLLGRRAVAVVERQTGVSRRIAEDLLPLYHLGSFRKQRNLLVRSLVLAPLAFLWREGGFIKRRRSERYASAVEPLHVAVVSVGGITIGGSGKTPFTSYLATRLRQQGWNPAILTRGYRRRWATKYVLVPPAAKTPTAFTGDEAQIFLRAATAPLGIGTDRYTAARLLLSKFPETDVLVLDDGFQHARLRRDLDVVLIDGLDPFGGGDVVPLGRLREPLSALKRASVFVVTKCKSDVRFRAIAGELNKHNRDAPVFRSQLVTRAWHDSSGKPLHGLPGTRVAAFCGLGNPASFWDTLQSLGLDVVFCWTFEDHHSYKPDELQRLTHQARLHRADCLVTTEKDWINFPSDFLAALGNVPLAWLEIELELDDEAGFFTMLERRLSTAC
jgi:3-deoxy-D-manno-octulosonic-acid transferase